MTIRWQTSRGILPTGTIYSYFWLPTWLPGFFRCPSICRVSSATANSIPSFGGAAALGQIVVIGLKMLRVSEDLRYFPVVFPVGYVQSCFTLKIDGLASLVRLAWALKQNTDELFATHRWGYVQGRVTILKISLQFDFNAYNWDTLLKKANKTYNRNFLCNISVVETRKYSQTHRE